MVDLPAVRGRIEAETAARMVADMGDKAARQDLALETEREVSRYLEAEVRNLERGTAVLAEQVQHEQRAVGRLTEVGAELTRELSRLRDVLGMGLTEDPSTYLARIRQDAAEAEALRWSTALGLSSPETAKIYIGKMEAELEGAGKPTPHQPAPAPVTITQTVVEVDPAQVAAAVDKAAAEAKGDGKRRATPRRERFTIAELCAAIAAVRARALGPSTMTEQLPAALAPFVGKVLVATPAGEQPAAAPAPEPTTDADPMVLVSTSAAAYPVRWRPMDNMRRLVLVPVDRFAEQVLATIGAGADGTTRQVTTGLGLFENVVDDEHADARAEAMVVESMAGVIANITGRDVLLGATRPKEPTA